MLVLTLHSQVLAVLGCIDEWQFDIFRLNEVSNGCPLSLVAFAIMKNCDLVPGRSVYPYGLGRSQAKIKEGHAFILALGGSP